MDAGDHGLAASPSKFELLLFAFFIVLAGLDFLGADGRPELFRDLVDDLQATVTA
jgi:hypothetical protein